jgi:hypothetical protein
MQLIKGYLQNHIRNDLISNLKNNGAEYAFKLFGSYRDFVWSFLKPAFIACCVLFVYVLAVRRGQRLANLPFFQANSAALSAISSKIKSAAPILLAACALVVFCSTLRGNECTTQPYSSSAANQRSFRSFRA